MLNIGAETFLASLTALSLTDLPKGSQECFLCFEPYQAPQHSVHPIRLPCNHIICKDCLANWIKSSTTNANNNSCPFCRAELFERDDDDVPLGDERDDNHEIPFPEALRPRARDRRAPSPAEDQHQRSAEYQRVVEQFEQFDQEFRAWTQPLRESHTRNQLLRETRAATDDAERLRWYIPRRQPELPRLRQQNTRTRVALPRPLAPRRRPHVQDVPSLVRSDADYEGLTAMMGAHSKEVENLERSDDVCNIEPRINQATRATRNPAARSTRVHVEEVRNNENYEPELRRFGQDTAASTSFAARMSAHAEKVSAANETPREWHNRETATLWQSAAEERARIVEVVNRSIRHEEPDAPLERLRRQNASLGTGIGGADVRGGPWLGEEAYQIPTAHEPGTPLQRHNRRVTAMREEQAREGAPAFGLVNQFSGRRGPDASPQWPSGGIPTLGAGIGGADVSGGPLLP